MDMDMDMDMSTMHDEDLCGSHGHIPSHLQRMKTENHAYTRRADSSLPGQSPAKRLSHTSSYLSSPSRPEPRP